MFCGYPLADGYILVELVLRHVCAVAAVLLLMAGLRSISVMELTYQGQQNSSIFPDFCLGDLFLIFSQKQRIFACGSSQPS